MPTYVHKHYETMAALRAVAVSKANLEVWKDLEDEYRTQTPRRRKEWLGVGSMPELHEIMATGWTAGRKKMDKISAEISAALPRVRKARRRVTRAPQGDELDIHAVRAGSLDKAWRRMRRQDGPGQKKAQVVRVVLDLTCSSAEGSSTLFWAPAVGLLMAERLMKAGYAVEILAAWATSNVLASLKDRDEGGAADHVTYSVTLKSAHGPLIRDNLALVALAGFFRTAGFKAMLSNPHAISGTFGWPTRIADKDVRPHYERSDVKTIICPAFRDKARMVGWVEETCAQVIRD